MHTTWDALLATVMAMGAVQILSIWVVTGSWRRALSLVGLTVAISATVFAMCTLAAGKSHAAQEPTSAEQDGPVVARQE